MQIVRLNFRTSLGIIHVEALNDEITLIALCNIHSLALISTDIPLWVTELPQREGVRAW